MWLKQKLASMSFLKPAQLCDLCAKKLPKDPAKLALATEDGDLLMKLCIECENTLTYLADCTEMPNGK